MLNLRIGEVAEGTDKKGVAAFEALGISQIDLQDHLHDTAWVIDTVIDRLDKLHLSAAQRAPILREIAGRGGINIKPLLALGDEIKHLADFQKQVGADVAEENAKVGHSFSVLKEEVSATWDGIVAELGKPLLMAIHDNLPEIEQDLIHFSQVGARR